MGHMRDAGTGGAVLAEGFLAGTRIATGCGWSAVEALRPGDGVQTFEAGVQPLVTVHAARFAPVEVPEVLWSVFVPRDALDNRDDLLLLPQQHILIEAECAEDMYGDRFALVPAAALDVWRGIRRRRPRAGAEVLHLSFDAPQIVYASRATLVACPGRAPRWHASTMRQPEPDGRARYAALSLSQAEHLVACLMAEDLGAALWGRSVAGPRRWF